MDLLVKQTSPFLATSQLNRGFFILMSYAEKLKDPRWQRKRLEIMQRDDFTCQCCQDAEKHLNVHHLYYSGSNPWESKSDALVTVCQDCHTMLEEQKKDLYSLINRLLEQKRSYGDIIELILKGIVAEKTTENAIVQKEQIYG